MPGEQAFLAKEHPMTPMPSVDRRNDPLIVDWVVDRLAHARDRGDDATAGTCEAWLDDEALGTGLRADPFVALNVLEHVAPDRLAPFAEELLAGWPGEGANWTEELSGLLARICPDAFLDRLRAVLSEPNTASTPEILDALLNGVATLGPRGANLAREALDAWKALTAKDDLAWSAVAAAAGTGLPETGALVAHAIRIATPADDPEEGDRLLDDLGSVEELLSGGARFTPAFGHRARNEGDFEMAVLKPLCVDGAPLRDMDRLSGLAPSRWSDRLEKAADLVRKAPGAHPVTVCAREILRDLGPGSRLPHRSREPLAAFLLAAVTHAWLRPDPDPGPACDSRTLVTMMASDVESMPGQQHLLRRLEARSRAEACATLREALPEVGGDGAARLATAAGRLAAPTLIPALLDALAEDRTDTLNEEAEIALSRLGTPAVDALVAAWDGLDDCQQLYGLGVMERVGGEAVVRHLVRTLPDMRAARLDLELWLETARAVPDPRLLVLVDGEMHRRQPMVDKALLVLCGVLGIDRPGLPEARARVEAETLRIANEFREDGTIPEDLLPGALLPLLCGHCKHENVAPVAQVDHDSRNFRIDPELPCPSCGRAGRLVPDPQVRDRLTAELSRMQQCEAEQRPYDGILRKVAPTEGAAPTPARADSRVSRNDPCPCGSGKKYKKCCLTKE
jgi:hypothetical protein